MTAIAFMAAMITNNSNIRQHRLQRKWQNGTSCRLRTSRQTLALHHTGHQQRNTTPTEKGNNWLTTAWKIAHDTCICCMAPISDGDQLPGQNLNDIWRSEKL